MSEKLTKHMANNKIYSYEYEDKDNEMESKNLKDYSQDYQELNPEQVKIAKWLENLSFSNQLFGGVNECDVWKKIIELNALYEEALKAERMRCNILIEYYKSISLKELEKNENE